MRRVMVLALLALGLPTGAFASSIDVSTGTFESGTFTGSFTSMIGVSLVGSENTISIDTGKLTLEKTCGIPGAQCYGFTTGSVTVASGGSTVFSDALSGGTVFKIGTTVIIGAGLEPNPVVAHGLTSTSFTFSGTNLTGGTASVVGSAVPEPGTLGLLGTGLIGLAGIARRKLKRTA